MTTEYKLVEHPTPDEIEVYLDWQAEQHRGAQEFDRQRARYRALNSSDTFERLGECMTMIDHMVEDDSFWEKHVEWRRAQNFQVIGDFVQATLQVGQFNYICLEFDVPPVRIEVEEQRRILGASGTQTVAPAPKVAALILEAAMIWPVNPAAMMEYLCDWNDQLVYTQPIQDAYGVTYLALMGALRTYHPEAVAFHLTLDKKRCGRTL